MRAMEWNITAGRPVYVQLIEQLEQALAAGEYAPGSAFPPVRELAAAAGVNPNTMQRALQALESRGLLQAQRTAGRTVTADAAKLAALRAERAAALAAELDAGATAASATPPSASSSPTIASATGATTSPGASSAAAFSAAMMASSSGDRLSLSIRYPFNS